MPVVTKGNNTMQEELLCNDVPIIQGADAKVILKHFTACFIAVSKHQAVYSEVRLLEIRNSYKLIKSLEEGN
jgi:hypothetical protein